MTAPSRLLSLYIYISPYIWIFKILQKITVDFGVVNFICLNNKRIAFLTLFVVYLRPRNIEVDQDLSSHLNEILSDFGQFLNLE